MNVFVLRQVLTLVLVVLPIKSQVNQSLFSNDNNNTYIPISNLAFSRTVLDTTAVGTALQINALLQAKRAS